MGHRYCAYGMVLADYRIFVIPLASWFYRHIAIFMMFLSSNNPARVAVLTCVCFHSNAALTGKNWRTNLLIIMTMITPSA